MASSPINSTAGFESSNDHSLMSVLELTKKPLPSVPQQYIRTDHNLFDNTKKPPMDSSFPTIPKIDFKNLVMEETTDLELEKLHFACKDWGIFQVIYF